MTSEALSALTAQLGHPFANKALLNDALTHPSLGGVKRTHGRGPPTGQRYERLEFLGDRVLALVIAAWLFERHPNEPEGSLAKRLTALVRAETLADIAEGLALGEYLKMSAGADETGTRANRTVLADACEAMIGALYLDGGLSVAERFIRTHWAALVDQAIAPPEDAKTALQQWAQARGQGLPIYEVLSTTGLSHAPVFAVRVSLANGRAAVGEGGSKRVAEMAAAKLLMKQLAGEK